MESLKVEMCVCTDSGIRLSITILKKYFPYNKHITGNFILLAFRIIPRPSILTKREIAQGTFQSGWSSWDDL
eukprot:12460911-Ditylum_brightwellii.AAC.1